MALEERLRDELKKALKGGNKRASSAIRMVLAAAQNRAIEKRGALEESDYIDTLSSAVKQRREAIGFYREGNRPDLVSRETEEIEILQAFLPPPLSEDDVKGKIRAAVARVSASSPRDVGKVMKVLIPELRGRVEGATLNRWVSEVLGLAHD